MVRKAGVEATYADAHKQESRVGYVYFLFFQLGRGEILYQEDF